MKNNWRGPWKKRKNNTESEVVDSFGVTVCDNVNYYPHPVDEDNMDLIAAAPEMYEALVQALVSIEDDEIAHGREFGVGKVIREALKKARGEA